MTRDEARDYFKSKGLTYSDIELADLHYLKELINRQFIETRIRRMTTHEKPQYWIRVNDAKYYKGEFLPPTEKKSSLIRAFMTGKGAYFNAREVISFEKSGFIGFCGEADDENARPVLAAFVEWCDWLAERKEAEQWN